MHTRSSTRFAQPRSHVFEQIQRAKHRNGYTERTGTADLSDDLTPLTAAFPASVSLVMSVINCRFQLGSYTAHPADRCRPDPETLNRPLDEYTAEAITSHVDHRRHGRLLIVAPPHSGGKLTVVSLATEAGRAATSSRTLRVRTPLGRPGE